MLSTWRPRQEAAVPLGIPTPSCPQRGTQARLEGTEVAEAAFQEQEVVEEAEVFRRQEAQEVLEILVMAEH